MTLAIYCAGGLGKEIVAIARAVNKWDNIIFVDDITECEWYEDAKVYRFHEIERFLAETDSNVEFLIANGEPLARERLFAKIKSQGYKFATLFCPGCAVLPGAIVKEGCILYDCGISADAVIEQNVLINTKTIIGHDVTIGAHSVLAPFCFLGGHTKVGEKVYMAPGAMAKDKICIGREAILSLGAVVLRSVRDRAIMVGNPAKRIGENTEGKVFGVFD
ncbi:MAG: acetyltransferase [Schwartzia sp. (in: firmicutes)]